MPFWITYMDTILTSRKYPTLENIVFREDSNTRTLFIAKLNNIPRDVEIRLAGMGAMRLDLRVRRLNVQISRSVLIEPTRANRLN